MRLSGRLRATRAGNLSRAGCSTQARGFLCDAARLCGVVGLDKRCDDLIAALAAAAGVHVPAPPGSPAEQKQVAALAALVALARGPSAALIGSGWVTILRTLSALEALQVSRCTTALQLLQMQSVNGDGDGNESVAFIL